MKKPLKKFPRLTSDAEAEAFVEAHARAKTMAEFQGLLLGMEQARENREVVGAALPALR